MGKDIKQLNRDLKFEFSGLDITGKNIEGFYSKKLQEFLLYSAELSPLQKIEASFMRMSTPLSEKSEKNFKELHPPRLESDEEKELHLQVNDKSEITIQKILSERTFIQDQIVRHEANLKEPIHPDNREKVNLWVDYLKQKNKAISKIELKVPEWSVPLIALYYVYHDIRISDDNKKEKAEALGYKKTASDLKDQYYIYKDVHNRTYGGLGEEEKGKANAQSNRLLDLKLIMEDRGEKDTPSYNWLLSDIEKLKKELGHK